jgi:uncharacterized protein
MRIRIGSLTLLAGLLVIGYPARAAAQNQSTPPNVTASDGISVFGTGEVTARPNCVEIDLDVSGKAELSGDAQVKYRDAKKRLIEALDKLGLKDLSTEERGVSITAGISMDQQQRIVNNVPQTVGKPQIDVSSTVRLCLKNVRDVPAEELVKTIGKLIDVAQDAGVNVGLSQSELLMRQRYGMFGGQNSNVRFIVDDLIELREKAYERAVADARDRASRLARLNHVKLGLAVSVQEIQVAGDNPPTTSAPVSPYYPFLNLNTQPATPESVAEPRISSPTLTDIPVQVKLLVRFSIQTADPATAQE